MIDVILKKYKTTFEKKQICVFTLKTTVITQNLDFIILQLEQQLFEIEDRVFDTNSHDVWQEIWDHDDWDKRESLWKKMS